VNSAVFKRDLKTAKLDDDVMLDRRVFHTCAAATGKVRPPIVAQRTREMMRSAVYAAAVDSLRQPHEIRRQDIRRCQTIEAHVDQ